MNPSNIEFKISEVSPRTVLACYEDYYSVNAGAIALDDFIIIIDTLVYPWQGKKLREHVETKFGLPVKYLFITHFHGDHHYGSVAFKDVEIFGSNAMIERMKRRMIEGWKKEDFDKWKEEDPQFADYIDEIEITLPSVGFDKMRTITNNDLDVEFYHSGGHCAGESYAYFPDEKVLFTGDDLATKQWPYIFESCGDPERWIKTFEHMLELDVDVFVPGHGSTVGKEHIEEQLGFLVALKDAVLEAVSDGKSPEDIKIPEFYKPATDWQIPSARTFLHSYYSKNF